MLHCQKLSAQKDWSSLRLWAAWNFWAVISFDPWLLVLSRRLEIIDEFCSERDSGGRAGEDVSEALKMFGWMKPYLWLGAEVHLPHLTEVQDVCRWNVKGAGQDRNSLWEDAVDCTKWRNLVTKEPAVKGQPLIKSR